MAVVPIESNPDVINKLLNTLGVSDKWKVTDVYGISDDLLQSVPRPVLSLILLFPTSKAHGEHGTDENAVVEKEKVEEISPSIYHMKQNMHNVCGTVAIIHSIANNLGEIELSDGCLKQFLTTSSDLTPEERGEMLRTHGILEAHKAVANEGQTDPLDVNDEVGYHFIAFVCKDGQLYELDGNKSFPVVHGPSRPDTLLEDAVEVVKHFMARDPGNLKFTLLALTPASDSG